MAKFRLLTFTQPVAGREDEFNDWYANVHLPQVLSLPGFQRAQRFRLARSLDPTPPPPYLALYEIEADSVDVVLGGLRDASAKGLLTMSDSFLNDPQHRIAAAFEEFGPVVEASA